MCGNRTHQTATVISHSIQVAKSINYCNLLNKIVVENGDAVTQYTSIKTIVSASLGSL